MKAIAQLIAEAVAVVCPKCGEAQPNHEGSELWLPEDFAKHSITKCTSCEEPLMISHTTKVQFDAPKKQRRDSK